MQNHGLGIHSYVQYLGYKINSHWMSVVCCFIDSIDYMHKLKYQHNAKLGCCIWISIHTLSFSWLWKELWIMHHNFLHLIHTLKVKLVRIRFHQNSAGCKSWWKQSKFWKFFCPNSSPIIETKSEIIPQYTMWTVNDVPGKNSLEKPLRSRSLLKPIWSDV